MVNTVTFGGEFHHKTYSTTVFFFKPFLNSSQILQIKTNLKFVFH